MEIAAAERSSRVSLDCGIREGYMDVPVLFCSPAVSQLLLLYACWIINVLGRLFLCIIRYFIASLAPVWTGCQ